MQTVTHKSITIQSSNILCSWQHIQDYEG